MDVIKIITTLSSAVSTRNTKKLKNEFSIPFASLPPSSPQDYSRSSLQQIQGSIRKNSVHILCTSKYQIQIWHLQFLHVLM